MRSLQVLAALSYAWVRCRPLACLQGLQISAQVPFEARTLLLAEVGLALYRAVEACQALLADICCLPKPQGC